MAGELKKYSLFGVLSRVRDIISMRTGEDVTMKSEELFQYLEQVGVTIEKEVDLDSLPFVDWGGSGKTGRQKNFFAYYEDQFQGSRGETSVGGHTDE